jgi:hypothetical protein
MRTRCPYLFLGLAFVLFGCGSGNESNTKPSPDLGPETVSTPDAESDTSTLDTSTEDAGPEDAGTEDAGPEDAGTEDAGTEDASPEDASPEDANPEDASPEDASPEDANPEDAGPEDIGPEDAGTEDTTTDTGTPLPVCGDENCDPDENASTCPADCPAVCGDGVCSPGESAEECPEECTAECPGPGCVLNAAVYVATDGDDEQAGTLDAPWKTVERALTYIASGSELPIGGVTVWIRGGTYYIEKTIVLNESHSGSKDSPITIKAYPGEEAIFIGGRLITGWAQDSGKVYKTMLADVANGTWRFDQLYENSVRQSKARHPNKGYLRTDAPTGTPTLSFKFKAGQVPSWSNYAGAQASIWATANWFENIVPISSINFKNRTITVSKPLRQKNTAEDRYFIQGVKAALDIAGEFYLDESSGELFYWPITTPIADQQIVAPTVKNVFEFKGSSATDRVEHITLEGLTIWGSLFTNAYRSGGYSTGPEASGNRPGEEDREGLVQMENATHITVLNCTLYNAGHCCVNMGYYASHNTIQGNAISDCGSYGVLTIGKDSGEGVIDSPSEQIYDNKFHNIYNNHIHNCGVLAGDTAGIYLYQSGDNEITHNLVHGMPRYAIGMKGHGGLYGKYKKFGNVTITDDNYWDFYTGNQNTIGYNHVYDLLKDSYDAGGISLRRSGLYNVIDNNRIHDIHPPSSMDYHFCFGIYLDGGTSYTDITNNVIYDVSAENVGYPIKLKKVHNTVTNNILVLEAGTNGTLAMQEGGGGQPESAGYGYHKVTRNILYAKGEAAVLYWFKSEDEFDCGLVSVSDYNLFYLPDGGPYTFQSIDGADNFANWKKLCGAAYAQNSITKNPLCVNVAKDNYNLSPNSPAYDIGFAEIDQSKAGLNGDDYILVDHLTANAGNAAGKIKLSWKGVSNASSYMVKRSTSSGSSYSTIATPKSPGYTDTGLTQETRYYYKVSAVIDDVDAPNSRETSALPAPPATVLFSDNFESGKLSKWKHSGWEIVTGKKNGGKYSARAKVDSSYLFRNVDISKYSTITLSFYYRDLGADADDQTFLRFYDGTDHIPIFELGATKPEETWHFFTKTIKNAGVNAKYFHPKFQFRWTMGYLDDGEMIWIDDVVVSAK